MDKSHVDAIPLLPSMTGDLEERPNVYKKAQRVWARLTDRERREAAACYYASITEIDDVYGRLVGIVEQAGQLDNTIVVVAADQADAMGANSGEAYLLRGGPHWSGRGIVDLQSFGSTALAGDIARVRPPAGSNAFHFGGSCDIAHLDGDANGEILVAIFGSESDEWVGKRIILFNDPSVKGPGGIRGGIRIRCASKPENPARHEGVEPEARDREPSTERDSERGPF